MGLVAAQPLPSRVPPTLQKGVQNQKWPTNGPSGYITLVVSGVPNTSRPETNQKWRTRGPRGHITLVVPGDPNTSQGGPKSEEAHKWA